MSDKPEIGSISDSERLFTVGEWSDEIQSAQYFDQLIEQSGLFKSYREIRGFYMQPRPGQDSKFARIDRILIPNPQLINQGWKQGVVGIELKRSGIKAGPVLSQMLDYSRAIWQLNHAGGIRIWLNWVFLWPLHKTHSTWASIMAQNRLGSCDSTTWAKLGFYSGEQLILRLNHDGSIILGEAKNGNRAGSR